MPGLVTKREYNKLLADLRGTPTPSISTSTSASKSSAVNASASHASTPPPVTLPKAPAPAATSANNSPRRPVVTKLLYGLARSIVLTTVKTDLHGRYVAHVFYALNNRGIDKTFLEGRYLNQELVDKGFAKAV